MRIAFVVMALWMSGALAGPAAPTGLDRLAQVLPGTWTTHGQTFDSPFTKAGPQDYTTRRDCWRDADSYKCVWVVNGSLQLYDIFSWDAEDQLYQETQITPKGRQPDFHISVKGDTWIYDQDIERPDNTVIHYRILRVYTSATSASYSYSFSTDGKRWTDIAKGTETRADGAAK
ncbi:MAG TPA: hypothetical protein VGH91_12375 [Gammaproteobacteria bacterium]|jgi:hypothetical protein